MELHRKQRFQSRICSLNSEKLRIWSYLRKKSHTGKFVCHAIWLLSTCIHFLEYRRIRNFSRRQKLTIFWLVIIAETEQTLYTLQEVNPTTPGCQQNCQTNAKSLKHLLQDIQRMFDHFVDTRHYSVKDHCPQFH